jgi:tetratricopeptide (TPR) repeat protein
VTSSGWLAFTLAELGEFEAARGYLERAHQAAETSGQAYTQTIARTLAGLVWMRRGQLDRALALLQKSLDACREKNLDVWRPIPSSLLGLTCMLLGRADEGLRLLGDGVLLTDELGVKAYLSLWTANMGEGLLVAGQVERARTMAQRALDLAVAHKERGHQAWALRLLGDIAAAGVPGEAGGAEKAAAYYGQSLSLAEELGMRPLVARNHLGRGRLYRQVGDRERALEHLATASTMLSQFDMRFWLKRAGEELMALGRLVIVARDNVPLYESLKQEFSGEPVTIILDRRRGERREADLPHAEEHRDRDRRTLPAVDEALRARGVVVLPEPGPAAPPPSASPD